MVLQIKFTVAKERKKIGKYNKTQKLLRSMVTYSLVFIFIGLSETEKKNNIRSSDFQWILN